MQVGEILLFHVLYPRALPSCVVCRLARVRSVEIARLIKH
jgi:hypothetical protein